MRRLGKAGYIGALPLTTVTDNDNSVSLIDKTSLAEGRKQLKFIRHSITQAPAGTSVSFATQIYDYIFTGNDAPMAGPLKSLALLQHMPPLSAPKNEKSPPG